MLSQLVYVSVRANECSDEEIQKILASCIRNNGKIDITGVLLYSDKKFLQCLEGDYTQIMKLYDTIKSDIRHKNVILISAVPINNRSFPSWQMGSKKIDSNFEFSTSMSMLEKRDFNALLTGKTDTSTKAIDIIKKFF